MITQKKIVDYYNSRDRDLYYDIDFEEELLEAIREWAAVSLITTAGYSQDKLPVKEALVPDLQSTFLIPIDRLVDPLHYVIGCNSPAGALAIGIPDLVGNFTGDAYLSKYVKEVEEEQEKLLLQIGKCQEKIDIAKAEWKKYKEREGL